MNAFTQNATRFATGSCYDLAIKQKLADGKPSERMGRKVWDLKFSNYGSPTTAVSTNRFNPKGERKMSKKFTRLMAIVMTIIMCMSMICTSVSAASTIGRVTLNKTATALDENDQTTVTLNVGGEENNLGVDIVYILGAFLSREELETNTMIDCLRTTIGEIVADGTTVNFGMVPFSSTADPVMPLTAFKTAEDMENFYDTVYQAIQTAGDVYDGINMENAFVTAKEMFSNSELASHPERQHLVMISSGNTYFFNSGSNNENISTVPVRLIAQNGTDSKALFAYPEKIWQRARNNETNSYPIPYYIVQEYNSNPGEYGSLWDCYWHYIDKWAKADKAAGDSVVYEFTTRTAGDFIDKYLVSGGFVKHSNQSTFKYSSNGAIIAGLTEADLDGYVTINLTDSTAVHGKCGPNPLTVVEAAHAISNERAMWEAYNYLNENIKDAGINFYPVYRMLRADGTTTNGNHSYYDYTDQYIGHSFMNMLAGGTAVTFSSNKTFFDPIKRQIQSSVATGSYVEDYIGYEAGKGNFEFIDEASTITLSKGGVTYTTSKLETAKEGATSSYAFTAPGATEPTFWLDYYYGNGQDTEMFVWSFGEDASIYAPAQLSYKLQLIDKAEEEGNYSIDTNLSATLYPSGSDFKVFPVPNVSYTARTPIHTLGSITVTKDTTGATTPADATFQLQKLVGETWTNLSEAVPFSAFVNNAYTFTELEEGTYRVVESGAEVEGYTLETTYGANVVLAKITAENGDTSVSNGNYSVTNKYEEIEEDDLIEIPDEDVPLDNAPETGDPILPFFGMAIASGAAAIFVGKIGKKKEDEE